MEVRDATGLGRWPAARGGRHDRNDAPDAWNDSACFRALSRTAEAGADHRSMGLEMTITVKGVEIEIQGAATVRVDGDKVVIEVGEREPVRFVPYEDHGIDRTVPFNPCPSVLAAHAN